MALSANFSNEEAVRELKQLRNPSNALYPETCYELTLLDDAIKHFMVESENELVAR